MQRKINVTLAFTMLMLLLSLAASTWWAVYTYKKYIEINPPTSISRHEKCSSKGLVAHWKLDGTSAGSTPDSSEQHNHGTLKYWFNDLTRVVFGAPKVINGVDGNGMEFRGRQWISGGNNSCFTTETFTLSAWVWQDHDYVQDSNKVARHPWPYNVPTIMAKGSWPYDGWWLCSTTADVEGTLHYRDIDLGIAWGDGFSHIKSGYRLPLREWHHIAVSMDNIKHEAQFYIDGKIYGAKKTGIPKWLVNWNHDLFVADYDGSGRWPWYGKLDDVRFYNRVLSNAEAQAIYSQTANNDARKQ